MSEKRRVMIVDDEPYIRAAYEAGFKQAGYETSICENGEQAIGEVITARPDVILLDIVMPGMGGLETLSKLSELTKDQKIPIIILSSTADPTTHQQTLDMGAAGFVEKSKQTMQEIIDVTNTALAAAA